MTVRDVECSKNIEKMCVSQGDGSTSNSDGNFIVVKGKSAEKIGREKEVIAPLAL